VNEYKALMGEILAGEKESFWRKTCHIACPVNGHMN
jgi:hypothetical protein